jgi:hypothetical protein
VRYLKALWYLIVVAAMLLAIKVSDDVFAVCPQLYSDNENQPSYDNEDTLDNVVVYESEDECEYLPEVEI